MNRTGMSWSARLLIGLVLVLAGAAAMTWGLAHSPRAARLLGVSPPATVPANQPQRFTAPTTLTQPAEEPSSDDDTARIATLENRLTQIESATQHAVGSAGRADALVVAFAARRAIDRGIALGYLENLLVQRFGNSHRAAVATIITAARQPVRLDTLIAEYERLAPELRSGGPSEGWWAGFSRELGELVQVRRADRPATTPEARYQRALQQLTLGNVDQALAETMRLPGAGNAGEWTAKARRYVAAQRALDEIESAALLDGKRTSTS